MSSARRSSALTGRNSQQATVCSVALEDDLELSARQRSSACIGKQVLLQLRTGAKGVRAVALDAGAPRTPEEDAPRLRGGFTVGTTLTRVPDQSGHAARIS